MSEDLEGGMHGNELVGVANLLAVHAGDEEEGEGDEGDEEGGDVGVVDEGVDGRENKDGMREVENEHAERDQKHCRTAISRVQRLLPESLPSYFLRWACNRSEFCFNRSSKMRRSFQLSRVGGGQ